MPKQALKQLPIVIPREKKSRKVNFTLRPSTCTAISKVLYYQGDSLNNLVNVLLEKYIEEHSELVYQYDQEHNKG